jgi:hypothetical protein
MRNFMLSHGVKYGRVGAVINKQKKKKDKPETTRYIDRLNFIYF